jgi:hypothetical protein
MHMFIALAACLALLLCSRLFNATGDAFAQFELLLREEIDESVLDLTLPNDDVSWSLLNTFKPVDVAGRMTNRGGLSSEGSAGYEASWRILTQRGGAIAGAVMTGNTLEMSGPGNKQVMGQTAAAPYLDPAKTPGRSYLDITMKLCRVVGQLTVNRQQIFADMATKPIAQVAAESTEDAVFQVRSMWEALFWSQGYGIVAVLDQAAGATITDASTTYVPVKAGTIFRFVVGQRYFAATLTAGVPTAYKAGDEDASATVGIFRCTDIDIDSGLVGFQSETGQGDIALADGDAIIMYGMCTISNGVPTSLAMESIETLLRSSGKYPGTDWDVATYRILKSFVAGDETNLVEPEIERLAAIVDKMADAGKPVPPLVVAESSVWTRMALLEKQNYGTVNIPQGGPFTAAPGVAGPVLSHQSFNFQRVTSAKCRPGAWHGFNPASFKRFMPLSNTIRWLMSQGGVSNQSGIFRLVTSGSLATELSAADFDFFAQLGQEDPRAAFRHIGLYSQKTANA